ncbi:MAG: PepSY-associated TM helix domain-containing protein [Bacteroidales bacterium]
MENIADTQKNRRRQSAVLSVFRKTHRYTAAVLFVFFFIMSVTGILLGWKKHSDGKIRPASAQGTSTELKDWLPLDSLHKKAVILLHDSIAPELSAELNRIDVRKKHGMVKFVFADHYHGIQLDGATGELLQITQRNSDLIEDIHNGVILDEYFGTGSEIIKLIYSSIMGLALLLFTITGFWLWYGPAYYRRKRRKQRKA